MTESQGKYEVSRMSQVTHMERTGHGMKQKKSCNITCQEEWQVHEYGHCDRSSH